MKKRRAKKQGRKAQKKSKIALAARLGVSRSTIYDWAKRGAPIDEGPDAVLNWAMLNDRHKHESQEARAARLDLVRESARKLRLANDEKEKRLCPMDIVQVAQREFTQMVHRQIARLVRDAPSVLVGLDEMGIRTELQRFADDFQKQLIAEFQGEQKQPEKV